MVAKAADAPGPVTAAAAVAAAVETAKQPSAQELAASKRQKKREVDRRCQREARQRTKARITYLEALVEELRQQDTSGQVASLMQQVTDARNERDQFARTLRGIEDSIRAHRQVLETGAARTIPPTTQSTDVADVKEKGRRQSAATVTARSPRAASSISPDASSKTALPSPPSAPTAEPPKSRTPSFVQSPFGHTATPALHHSDSYGLSIGPDHNIFNSVEEAACPHCATGQDGEADPKSLWRYANEVLHGQPRLSHQELQWEDECADDTPVRAVVEGWEATAKRFGGSLPPLWRALRRIDERIFPDVLPVERLAILRIMHLLYRYHADPTSQRADVPPWYFARPSQNMNHTYAIDFFTWPGVRERFVFSEHSYCADVFWHLMNKALRILWQYDFRDCYTFNRHSGQYAISRTFSARIADIKSWTMGPEFFALWPELYADIPSFDGVALPMTRIDAAATAPRRSIGGGEGNKPTSYGMLTGVFRGSTTAASRKYSFAIDDEDEGAQGTVVDIDGADIGQLAAATARAATNMGVDGDVNVDVGDQAHFLPKIPRDDWSWITGDMEVDLSDGEDGLG